MATEKYSVCTSVMGMMNLLDCAYTVEYGMAIKIES